MRSSAGHPYCRHPVAAGLRLRRRASLGRAYSAPRAGNGRGAERINPWQARAWDLRDADDDVLADTLSDTDGRFAIFDLRLAAGSYLMHASASGYAADEESFKVRASRGPS